MKATLDLREAKEVEAANKTPKDGKVYTQFFKRTNTDIIEVSSTIYMDYEALVHYRVKQFKNEFVNNHINDI